MRQKKCKGCGERFQPVRQLQVACSPKCALDVARKNVQAKRRRQYASDKEKIKTRSEWLKEAQAAVNRYVRARDKDEPCISCGRYHEGQYHAGHYRSVGSSPELRFELLNIHAQCAPCNNHLSGNIIGYRKGLVEKIGAKKVEWLEGPHDHKHYSIEEIKLIKIEFSRKAREIENERKYR